MEGSRSSFRPPRSSRFACFCSRFWTDATEGGIISAQSSSPPENAMKISRIAFAAIAVVAVAVAGCSKIHEKKDFTLEPGNSHNLKITAPLSEQKLTVALTSDQPVSIWVLLEKDVPGGKDDLDPT